MGARLPEGVVVDQYSGRTGTGHVADRRRWLDAAAEAWLHAKHSRDWYIGDATEGEWLEAYRAVLDVPAETPPKGGRNGE